MMDAVEVTRRLVAFDTINPPGRERDCMTWIADQLDAAGFETQLLPMGEERANLVARIGASDEPPLCFSGHIDTVPLGLVPWSRDPFAGEIVNGRLYGRGSSDMKAGVAAFVCALCEQADSLKNGRGILVAVAAGEETGSDGARALVEAGAIGPLGAVVIAEPTNNAPAVGHKGALWLKASFSGKTAHGSMPHLGINAAYKAAHALVALERLTLTDPGHPLGSPTLNVGTVHAGLNVNSVPDRAELGIDIRTVPGVDHGEVRALLARELGQEATLETLIDLVAVWTDADEAWMRRVRGVADAVTGATPNPTLAMSYFTDGSILVPAAGHPPAVILGPGDPQQAHRTDEYCDVANIYAAVDIYSRIIADWRQ
ncbi:MAG TPA: M20 family metallopeptidase [Pseudolabrys sp.]|nr:M20 family metallopeptidase [Pseudolabrys sp.]